MATKFSDQVFGAVLLFLVLQPFAVKSRLLNLESLQNLEQVRKGDSANGLNQVKKHLKAFGYYPQHINLVYNDHFDNFLESALKAYQKQFHLKVTGKIDPDTFKLMTTPRCGVRDIIPDPSSDGSKATAHAHNNDIFEFVAHYSLIPGSPRWTKYDLTYNFQSAVQLFSVEQLSPTIAWAFQRWEDVSPFRFQQVAQGTRADIKIGFFRRNHGDGYPFDGPRGTLAHAYAPRDGRFHYDADEKWSFNPTASNQFDLESIAVHEIGHLLGLGHSREQIAIMYPYAPEGTTKRNLTQDDIDGLQALYRY